MVGEPRFFVFLDAADKGARFKHYMTQPERPFLHAAWEL